jgi:hypothetical protein
VCWANTQLLDGTRVAGASSAVLRWEEVERVGKANVKWTIRVRDNGDVEFEVPDGWELAANVETGPDTHTYLFKPMV